jgi:hypothetical protein
MADQNPTTKMSYQCGQFPGTFSDKIICALQKRDDCSAPEKAKTNADRNQCMLDFMMDTGKASYDFMKAHVQEPMPTPAAQKNFKACLRKF